MHPCFKRDIIVSDYTDCYHLEKLLLMLGFSEPLEYFGCSYSPDGNVYDYTPLIGRWHVHFEGTRVQEGAAYIRLAERPTDTFYNISSIYNAYHQAQEVLGRIHSGEHPMTDLPRAHALRDIILGDNDED